MRISVFFIGLVYMIQLSAQDKLLSITEAISGYHLYPSKLTQLQWLPGGNHFSHIAEKEEQKVLLVQEIESTHNGNLREVHLEEINKTLEASSYETIKAFPFIRWINDKEFGFNHSGVFLAYDIENKHIRKIFDIREDAGEIIYTGDYKAYCATVEEGIVYERDGKAGTISGNAEGILIGQAVHRNEFGIHNGLFPSPDGSKLAYYYMDESMVSTYPLYQLNDTPAGVEMIRYPVAGAPSHHVSLRIRNMSNDSKDVILKTGKPLDHYLTNICWTPDNRYILIAEVNRAQNHMALNMYDAESGELIKTLFEEHHEKYVEPEHPPVFLKKDPGKFVWWSERDGYNHLYLYDLEGKLIKQLTKGNWIVTEFYGFSESEKEFFISATKESPLERHLYRVNIGNGKMLKLTAGEGVHQIQSNASNQLFIDHYSNPEVSGEIRIIDRDANLIEILHKAENPLADYKLGQMEMGMIKGKGGDDLYYRVFKPVDFDPAKKYPAVVYLYNGPHLQLITKRWMGGANLWYQYMAQKGYVVFSIDGRGSANRGFEFESAIFRNVAAVEMEDQLSGVEWLKSQNWVDSNRLGIHGWSYGGFMTISMMTRTPGIFKVGVAGGPVIDWRLYEVMYTERYMDTPQENPEGYATTELKQYIKNLEGELLVIHGGLDNVVLWQHSLQYIEEAIKQGKQLDYFVYPHHEHNVLGKDRVHLYEKISDYFIDRL